MIDVQDVLRAMPHFDTFCSLRKLHELLERLRADARFEVREVGTSANGVPIHHVRFGKGRVKALLVAFPHCMEPIGGLTVYSLMTLLQQGERTLCEADVEWNIVPCIDPDGALLNEGWSQQPFDLERYMKNRYLQAIRDQVDFSFPIAHKKLVWDQPIQETRILMGLLERIRPDFYFDLHNTWMGGAFYFLTRDIDHQYHDQLYALLERQGMPLQKRPIWWELSTHYGAGILSKFSIRQYYDFLERSTPAPEKLLPFGGHSADYLAQIKPEALTFVAEMGYLRHPDEESDQPTGENLRQFKLRVDADSKYLAAVLLQEWERTQNDLDTSHPIYKAIMGGGTVLPRKENLNEGGLPMSRHTTRDLLFNPLYDRTMTRGDRFNAGMISSGFLFLFYSYQFVRLLKASRQTEAVRGAVERLDRIYADALAEVARNIDFSAFRVMDCDTLARVQLGSGLIVLNSLLEAPQGHAAAPL